MRLVKFFFDDPVVLAGALADCGLVWQPGQGPWRLRRDWPAQADAGVAGLGEAPLAPHSHAPHEIGVCWLEVADRALSHGRAYAACWDQGRGGFGLEARIGPDGGRLLAAYNARAVVTALARWHIHPDPACPQGRLDAAGDLHLYFQGDDNFMAARVKATIHPDGKTELKVEGVQGSACQDVTKAVELALGVVESDQPTDEMLKHEEVSHEMGG